MDNGFLWVFLPLFVAIGSALLAIYLMQSKLEVAVSKERETLAEARAIINAQHKTMEERVRAVTEETKRKALDDFLSDFRVEERHYLRESKSLFMNRKSMILQERLYFRNIPLSNWVEHEMVVEDGNDIQRLAKACSVFSTRSLDNASQQMARDLNPAAAVPQAGTFELPRSSSRMLGKA
jgi:ATP-dependent DNA ligase